MDSIEKSARVYVAGHRGLVGSAVVRALEAAGYTNILTTNRDSVDLRNQQQVDDWFTVIKPEYVFLVAGTVGGIWANSQRPGEFLYDNMMIHANVVHSSYLHGVTKLVYLGSSCIYPKLANQPMKEDELLTGALEPTNEPYAIAKIAGIKLCQSYAKQYGCNFVSGMPTNLYGPHDNFDLESSHVLPALMRKFHEAKISGVDYINVWGTGSAKREFLHADDLADACLFMLNSYDDLEHVNIGTGLDVSIKELAETLRDVIHPSAELRWDTSKPDGSPRKLLDVTKIHNAGWSHSISLADGIASTYEWFKANYSIARGIK
jgi:GDP-L-fucose synthase